MSRKNARELAVDSLVGINEKGVFLTETLTDVYASCTYLSDEDRGLYTRITEGSIQKKLYIDYFIENVSSVHIRKMKPFIRNLIRASVYQLLFLDRVPDYAVVNEAVKLVKKRGFGALSSFVNGVLRGISQKKYEIALPSREKDAKRYLSVRYSMPEWITEMWIEAYGPEKVEDMLRAYDLEDVPIGLWANLRKTTPENLEKILEDEGVDISISLDCEGAYKARHITDITKLKSYRDGFFYVQNFSGIRALRDVIKAIHAVHTLEGRCIKVLDACASPGGKSLFIANNLGDAVDITSRDVSENKTKKLKENVRRMGYEDIISISEGDALVFKESDHEAYEFIVLDVPCSGVLGRKPDIRYRVKPEDLDELSKKQRQMIDVAIRSLKPGGYLMYSTCTINTIENTQNAEYAVEKPCMELIAENQLFPSVKYPGADGFYYALLRKDS